MNLLSKHYVQDQGGQFLAEGMQTDAPKGWYELMRLKPHDRLEFVRDFWLATLPYTPHVSDFLHLFFASLDDIAVFVSGEKAHMLYSLSDNSTFFLGDAPSKMPSQGDQKLPEGYLKFFQIHNGFRKVHDKGILSAEELSEVTQSFRQKVVAKGLKDGMNLVDPLTLFPFYRSYSLEVYQCFYALFYVNGEMGNIVCALDDGYISGGRNSEDLAFPSFEDWLIFYLEGIE